MTDVLFFMNNYQKGGAQSADKLLKEHLKDRSEFKFYDQCFNFSFIKALNNASAIVIMNFFSLKNIFIMFLLLFQNKKKIYISAKGQLMPEAIKLKKTRKVIFINLFQFLTYFLKIRLIFTSMKEAISSKSLRSKECYIVGDLIDDYNELWADKALPNLDHSNLKYGYFGRVDRKKNIQFLFPILNAIGVKTFTIWGSFTDRHYFEELIYKAKDSNITLDYKGAYSRENFGEIRTSIDVFLMPTLAENFGYNILEARVMGMEICISEKTTPWDCEFDQLYNCEHVQFLKLDKEIWISKLPRKRSCSLFCNDAHLVEKLSIDRKSQLNQFLESIQE